MEHERVYYQHEAHCTKKDFTAVNSRGLRVCLDCAGVFDAAGKGVAVTDKRFDEEYEQRKAEVEADSRGENV